MKVDLDAIVAALAPGHVADSVVNVEIRTNTFDQRDGAGTLMTIFREVDALVITVTLSKVPAGESVGLKDPKDMI